MDEDTRLPYLPYFVRIEQSYPGLKTWMDVQRRAPGILEVMVFDLRVSSTGPSYVFRVHDSLFEDMLGRAPGDGGMMCCGFTASEFLDHIMVGSCPPGVPAPKESSDE